MHAGQLAVKINVNRLLSDGGPWRMVKFEQLGLDADTRQCSCYCILATALSCHHEASRISIQEHGS